MKLSPEEILQLQCINFLERFVPTVLFWHTPNGVALGNGKNRFAYMAKLKKLGVLPGVPDLVLHWRESDSSKTAYIELKAGKNRLTPAQKEVSEKLKSIGIPFFTVRSLPEFMVALNDLGIWHTKAC